MAGPSLTDSRPIVSPAEQQPVAERSNKLSEFAGFGFCCVLIAQHSVAEIVLILKACMEVVFVDHLHSIYKNSVFVFL